ncbi:MAG: flagellar basal body P-ring formation protein FlgA [Magnetococcales bacterium]|nr:flagellar basal body P-ring formation protein FlgA [Magnetococcales bacterium]
MSRLLLAGMVGLAWVVGAAVAWAHQELDAETINRVVAEKVRGQLAGQKSDLQLEHADYRYPVDLPDGVWECVLADDTPASAPGQRWLDVALTVNGRIEKRLRVPVTFKLELRLPVVKKVVQRGQKLGPGDMEWRTLVLPRSIPDLVRDPGEIVAQVATRRVNPGEALQGSWFERPMDIERGEQVRVLAGGSGFMIESLAVALDSGRVGDLIQLRNPDTQIRYEARISAPGTARIGTW